jgi:CheY-like chemotaxis protein
VGAIASTPRYQRVAAQLRERFRRGQYADGEPLPSQPRLAREFGVSLATLRQALDVLRDEGWISSNQGGSTRVTLPSRRRALIVEDDAAIRQLLRYAADESGTEAVEADNAADALAAAGRGRFSIMLVDVGLPDRDGTWAAAELHRLQPGARIVFVTATPGEALHAAERGVRPVEILPKPFDLDEVIALLGGQVQRSAGGGSAV